MNSKNIFLESEGDAYFERNRKSLELNVPAKDVIYYSNFLSKLENIDQSIKLIEIGAANSRNLNFFKLKFGINVSGIEPSTEVVSSGNELYFDNKKILIRGTSDSLPYEDESIDIVMFGFSLFWVDRKYLYKSISEADRVLREGGYMFITDFDTPIPYKMNYANLFLSNPQYYLVEKKSFSHTSDVFDTSIQERVSAQILYKDFVDNTYVFG